jgi:HK97 family phage portal protein
MRNRKQAPTPVSERTSQSMERWLTTTGVTDNPVSRDSFDAFLKKVTRDSLVYDQMAWEVVPNRKGKPAEFYAVDAATIRIADTTRLHLDHNDTKVNRYVQIYDGLVVNEYNSQELLFGVRNPTTRIGAQQYGVSELEMLAHTITSMLWAWQYNEKLFSQGTSAKGILNFKGAIPEKQLRAFRTHWYMMAAGIENAHKTPIVNSDDLQWINMQNTNKDMEFSAWMDFLIKVVCGIYGMDPMEINFKYGDSGGAKSMFESANNSKLSASKDKGLYPLLKFLELKINQSLIWPMDEDFEFKFVGLEAQSPTEQADLTTKLVKTIKTVNEARAEEDMPPLPNGLGDVILDPVWMQHLTMAQGAQQQYDAAQHAAENPPPGQEVEDGFQEDGGDEDADQDQPEFDMGADDAGEEGDKPAKPAKPAPVEKSLRKSQKRIVVDVEV